MQKMLPLLGINLVNLKLVKYLPKNIDHRHGITNPVQGVLPGSSEFILDDWRNSFN